MAIPKTKTAKQTALVKLLEWLGNPDNDFGKMRGDLSVDVLGYKDPKQINILFTAAELKEIYRDALDIRRKAYAPGLASADKALITKANDGDVAAIKLCYQRFEGWSEKQTLDIPGGISIKWADK